MFLALLNCFVSFDTVCTPEHEACIKHGVFYSILSLKYNVLAICLCSAICKYWYCFIA